MKGSGLVALCALGSGRRLHILEWLKNPEAHFPTQVDGGLTEDGVCGLRIAEKLCVSQPTASEHLRILTHSRFLRAKRIKQWTYYKRDEDHIRQFRSAILKSI